MYKLNDLVKVVDGKYKGVVGIVTRVVNRSDVRKSGLEITTIDGLKCHVVYKYIRRNTDGDYSFLLRRWVMTIKSKEVIEKSTFGKRLTHYKAGKNCLVTDVWEEDGRTLINLVFQGNYAIVPLDHIVNDYGKIKFTTYHGLV